VTVRSVDLNPFARRWHGKERKNNRDMQNAVWLRQFRHPVATISQGSGVFGSARDSIW
jgi:hypothetical protein